MEKYIYLDNDSKTEFYNYLDYEFYRFEDDVNFPADYYLDYYDNFDLWRCAAMIFNNDPHNHGLETHIISGFYSTKEKAYADCKSKVSNWIEKRKAESEQ